MADCTTFFGSGQSWICNIDVLNNIANSIYPIDRMITGASYLIGLMFAIKALQSLKAMGESRSAMSSGSNTGFKEPLVYFLVAAVLIYLPTAVKVIMTTTFGGDGGILGYGSISGTNTIFTTLFGQNSAVGNSITIIIQMIGLIAFIRGWVLIAKSSSQGGQSQGSTGKGVVHVVGGMLAMNIIATLQIVSNTLYGT